MFKILSSPDIFFNKKLIRIFHFDLDLVSIGLFALYIDFLLPL